ncbi:hypothetical protein J2847_002458 [Azospirillum agricola]|uniref:hypothetical protein n=1 Tax=Azospirillum agricola TaxID=1720247 RepID=UPI001AE6B43F|nr:hypothetical protein [Azospirillum agricola]MBP2229164.1 hypothetical protein [Azospirillum agricola]
MRIKAWTRLWRRMPALAGAMLLAVLLWPVAASAAPSPHAHHREATGAATAGHHSGTAQATTASVRPVLSMPGADAPCHHRPDSSRPPCCAGPACVSMHVGIAAEAMAMTMPSGRSSPPSGVALLEGEGVPPDLPPPRLG